MKPQMKSIYIQTVIPILSQCQNSRHLGELLYSWNDHDEALELCLGFYTFTINHILRVYCEMKRQFTKGEAQIANNYFFKC